MENTGTKTDLKAAKQTIKFFETLLRASTDGIVITDFSQNIIVVNEAFCNFLGKDYREVAETNLFVWLEQLDGDAPKHWAKMEEVVRRGEKCRDVEFAKTTNESALHLSVNTSVLERVGEEEAGVIISIWRDVTDQKRAEKALAHAAEDWQETFDAVDDLIAIVDSERNIHRANRAMKEVFGEINLKEKKCYKLFHGIDEPASLCPCSRSFETGELEHLEISEPHLDNRTFDVFTYPIRVDEGGIKKVVHVVRDITDRKNAEMLLKQAHDELEMRVKERTLELTEVNKKLQLEVTDRKRAEEVIRESEEKYSLLIDNANDGIVSIQDGMITFANPRVEELGGYKVEELTNSSFVDFIHPDEISIVAERHKRRLAGEDVVSIYESAIKHKDGHKIDVEFNVSAFTYKEKPAFQVFVRDITERKLAEESLKENEKRYRNMVENINDVIFKLDMDGNFTYISPAIERIFGYSVEEIVKQSFIEYVHPDDLDGLKKSKEQTVAGELEPYEFRVLRKDGEILHVRTSSRVQFEKGVPVGINGVMTDITEKKQAEDEINKSNRLLLERTIELSQSEKKWRTLFETSRDVVYISTVDGRFIDMNTAGVELFGYTRDELLSMDIESLLLNHDYIKVFMHIIEKKGFVKDHGITFKKKDGTVIDCLVTGNVRKNSLGNIIGYHGIIRDITERKRIEAQLVQTAKLSSLGEILSGVAHELNNPLTSIIGNAQLLARRSELPKDILNKLETIQKESMRCTKIVGGLLAFAREHKPERRMINVNDVIVDSYKLREYELKVDNVDIELDLSDKIPATSADPFQLQQVFINLINNAYDDLKGKKEGVLNIKSYKHDKTILIEFDDNGSGIPKENINKIFDPFFSTKKVGEGTGLGLSIIYGIINEHGGKMNVESEIDKGTKFTIELPILKEVEEIDEVEIVRTKKPEGTKSILVVEDEDSLRVLVSEALSSEGYVVDAANRGEEAIKLLKKGEYDAIISDMKMPGMSGQNFYIVVQKEYPELTDKMLFMTGDVLGKDTQNFFKATGVKYLEKPFEINVLLNVLNKVIFDRES